MSFKFISLAVVLSFILFSNNVFAQQQTAVTASVTGPNAIRLSSPGEISNIRLEVYSATGDLAFDSGLRQGNMLDWKLSETTQPIGDGTYLFVVTIRDLQGKYRQRLGNIVVEAGQATLKTQSRDAIAVPHKQALNTRLQSQKITLEDSVDTITVLRSGKERSLVLTTHDGIDGQLTSTQVRSRCAPAIPCPETTRNACASLPKVTSASEQINPKRLSTWPVKSARAVFDSKMVAF